MFNSSSLFQRSPLSNSDSRRSSTASSSRILSPIAFFHDGININDIDLRYNIIDKQRRAQAIATAPRRNRYKDDDDDDDDSSQKKTLLYGFTKTSPVSIPSTSKTQEVQSLPKIQLDMNLIPNFPGDRSERYPISEFNYFYDDKSGPDRFSSESLP